MTTLFSVALHCMAALGAAELPYSAAEKPWNSDWGNHRARVRVASPSDAVSVHLPWRRRDHDAADKAVFVIRGATEQRVTNAVPVAISRDSGTIIFQAMAAGEYDVYFTVRHDQPVAVQWKSDAHLETMGRLQLNVWHKNKKPGASLRRTIHIPGSF